MANEVKADITLSVNKDGVTTSIGVSQTYDAVGPRVKGIMTVDSDTALVDLAGVNPQNAVIAIRAAVGGLTVFSDSDATKALSYLKEGDSVLLLRLDNTSMYVAADTVATFEFEAVEIV